MRITLGTFNINNLFSRFNFQGVVDEIEEADGAAGAVTIRYEFTDPGNIRVRTFLGRLVKKKDPRDVERVVERILAMDADVLALQEVENIAILREFNEEQLGGLYAHQVLIEGNDPRFIDVALLSKLPLGAVSSHQTAVHPADTSRRVFGRDLLEVEVLNPSRSRRLFTLYNNHLKSHFVPFPLDPVLGEERNNERRKRQSETITRVVTARQRPNGRYIIVGDMNDDPGTASLAPMVNAPGLGLTNALEDPAETRPPKDESVGPGPQTKSWTHRFKRSGQPPEFRLFDQIWLSPALAPRQQAAIIDRRKRHGGDGSDHDPAWIELEV